MSLPFPSFSKNSIFNKLKCYLLPVTFRCIRGTEHSIYQKNRPSDIQRPCFTNIRKTTYKVKNPLRPLAV